ncbi:MAG TPA: glutamate synthase subunit beta [Candidatus Limnocylindrales bacterium]|nr:glutamate synthase subunit beta [Candidatus Limnocylindrales bacterium]
MPDPNGFLRYDRRLPARRPVPVRIRDWKEVYPPASEDLVKEQASRCMDCGIPFCTSDRAGCPLGNRIPDWNDLVRTGSWDLALESLHATNNFPEFTGRLCPAPCEAACVLGIGDSQPVTIKQVEVAIADRFGFEPRPATSYSGRTVAIVGSGPAGLAAAQQLARAGHEVTVFERDDRIGGLLRYGIPDFKLEKHHIDRRIAQLEAEGVSFRTGVNVGVSVSLDALRQEYDAVLLAVGALKGRRIPMPGSTLDGVHPAMDHLTQANRFVAFGEEPAITAAGKHIVIIGGGDTAADCLGVAHRQGAASVTQLDRYPLPPNAREDERDPWPTWPWTLRNYPAHEEGGDRVFSVAVQEFMGSGGRVTGLRLAEVTVKNRVATPIPDTERELPADLVLLAIGFDGTDAELDIPLSPARTVPCGRDWQTETPGVFVAGDAHRGASLIVWAIAEGRAAAASIHAYLGGTGSLPVPVTPAAVPLSVTRS